MESRRDAVLQTVTSDHPVHDGWTCGNIVSRSLSLYLSEPSDICPLACAFPPESVFGCFYS